MASGLSIAAQLSVDDELCYLLSEEGIIPLVVNAMRAHSETADVQDKGLTLCANISYHGAIPPDVLTL